MSAHRDSRIRKQAAKRGAIDPSFHGVNVTCWLRVLAAAMAAPMGDAGVMSQTKEGNKR